MFSASRSYSGLVPGDLEDGIRQQVVVERDENHSLEDEDNLEEEEQEEDEVAEQKEQEVVIAMCIFCSNSLEKVWLKILKLKGISCLQKKVTEEKPEKSMQEEKKESKENEEEEAEEEEEEEKEKRLREEMEKEQI